MNIIISAISFITAGALVFIARRVFGADSLTGAALIAAVEAAKDVLQLKLRGYVAEAEKICGAKTGQYKLSVVLDKVTESAWYIALPDEVKRKLDAKEITELVDTAVKFWLTPQLEKNAKLRALIIAD